jgi:hypothetical protein
MVMHRTPVSPVLPGGARRYLEIDSDYYAQVVYEQNTADQVPVPSVRDAKGQHFVAKVLRQGERNSLPWYHPDSDHKIRLSEERGLR